MISVDNLFFIANALGIEVVFKNLRYKHPDLYGMANAKTNTITLDRSLMNNTRKLKCILAEEIGHILQLPRPGHIAYHSTDYMHHNHRNRCNIQAIVAQDEHKALLWATGFLMPDDEFWRARENGVINTYEFAEWFDVEEWFVLVKLDYIRRRQEQTTSKEHK